MVLPVKCNRKRSHKRHSGFLPGEVREWSLFTAIMAMGAGGISKIAWTQKVPPLNNHALRFCPL